MGKSDGNPLGIDIHLDGPTLIEMEEFSKKVDGFTFNPTLFRNLGVTNYLEHCKCLAELEKTKPISLEVFADDATSMIKQAEILSDLGKNVFVKVPITFTNGELTTEVIKNLTNKNIKINITAIFSIGQVKKISHHLRGDKSILSVFSGRLFDIGINAVEVVSDIVEWNRNNSNAKVLWASPRQIYDLVLANSIGCDIITIPPNILKKLELFGTSPEEYSLETVKMFYHDSLKSKYTL